MQYRFAKERPDYSDLASGRVFYSLPGHPAFPIRLADEIFQRCLARRELNRRSRPCSLYDPCCGSAYHLSVLAYLHWGSIQEVMASDVDSDSVRVAQKNLSLLGPTGMELRMNEISEMLRLYRKESHQDALDSANHLREKIISFAKDHPLGTRTFQANALDKQQLIDNLKGVAVDIVFTDIPYGQHSQWRISDLDHEIENPLWHMLDALLGVLSSESIVAIASDKKQKAVHEGYRRLEQFQVGKRRVAILKPNF